VRCQTGDGGLVSAYAEGFVSCGVLKVFNTCCELDCGGCVGMKGLIVCDSVSPNKLTGKVAEAVGAVLREGGVEVDSFFVGDVDVAKVKDYDCVVVGGPTMYFRMSSGAAKFLDRLRGKEFSGKSAAAFGTQLESRLSGSAAKAIDGRLKKLGFRMIASPLAVYVEGKVNDQHLKDGELEKARSWARELAKALSR
jgi:flavorubredoxin